MVKDLIKRLIESGELKQLERSGLVSVKVRTQFEMEAKYQSIKDKSGVLKYDWEAIEQIAFEYKMESSTVYRAIKSMNQ